MQNTSESIHVIAIDSKIEQLFFEGTKHSFIHSFDRKSGKKNKYIYFSWNFGQIRIYNDQHLLCWFGLWGPLSSPFQRKTHWCDFNFWSLFVRGLLTTRPKKDALNNLMLRRGTRIVKNCCTCIQFQNLEKMPLNPTGASLCFGFPELRHWITKIRPKTAQKNWPPIVKRVYKSYFVCS